MNRPMTIQAALSQRTVRNLIGYMLFAVSAIIPAVSSWQREPVPQRTAPGFRSSPFDGPPSRRFGDRRGSQGPFTTLTSRDALSWAWYFFRLFLTTVGTTIAMLVLLPYSGCKRFAILFGPPTGIAVMTATSLWLAGRTSIYRVEPVLVAMIAAVPTGMLWILCCKSSYERHYHRRVRGSRDVPHEIEDDDLIE